MKKYICLLIFCAACFTGVTAQSNDSYTQLADEWPMFPGCENLEGTTVEIRQCSDEKLFDYLHSNLVYPELAKQNKVEGRVVIKFQINDEGNLSNPVIARDIGSGCGAAALAVVNKMIGDNVTWIPAKYKDKNVAMEFALPFRFAL